MKKPKNKFWIDCPLCDVRMKQGKTTVVFRFDCTLCGTVTEIPSITIDSRSKYRTELLERRRDKPSGWKLIRSGNNAKAAALAKTYSPKTIITTGR